MVWHTWNLKASIKAVEVLDEVLTKIIDKCNKEDIDIYITADHWNCECMFDETWEVVTSHTVNQVPFWYISKWNFVELKEKHGTLADVAPTILNNFWIEIPSEMNGKVL
jgi:2,3-bisphosphoglycerate-independent phosphoglycerate mutase